MQTTFSLRFLETNLQFFVNNMILSEISDVFDFFSSHFTITQERLEVADILIHVEPYDQFNENHFEMTHFEEVTIRKNYYENFNLFGEKGRTIDGKLEIINSRHTQTALVLNKDERVVTLYISSYSHIQVIDFIRDVILRIEEKRGSLVLHASAITNGQKTIAIVGRKGAGKSTFLLEMVVKHGFQFLTGDKLILRVTTDGTMVYGWPDYPSIGYGTILKYPKLVEYLELNGYQINPECPEDKILFPPQILKSALGYEYAQGPFSLDIVILPNVLDGEELSLDNVGIQAPSVTEHLELSIDYKFNNWNSLISSVSKAEIEPHIKAFSEALNLCSFWEIKGKGDLNKDHVEMILGLAKVRAGIS